MVKSAPGTAGAGGILAGDSFLSSLPHHRGRSTMAFLSRSEESVKVASVEKTTKTVFLGIFHISCTINPAGNCCPGWAAPIQPFQEDSIPMFIKLSSIASLATLGPSNWPKMRKIPLEIFLTNLTPPILKLI
jgi:hypothetical protein